MQRTGDEACETVAAQRAIARVDTERIDLVCNSIDNIDNIDIHNDDNDAERSEQTDGAG